MHALFQITSGKKLSNNYAPFFNRIDSLVILLLIELSWCDFLVLQNFTSSFKGLPPFEGTCICLHFRELAFMKLTDYLRNLLLILSEFKRIN